MSYGCSFSPHKEKKSFSSRYFGGEQRYTGARSNWRARKYHKESQGKMQVGSKMATVAVVLVGLTLVGASAASAYQESDVSIAYADGYMGTDGQFHVWEHRADAEQFRAKHLDQYRAWRHDDPRHQGDH
jgi:hypothetical protein